RPGMVPGRTTRLQLVFPHVLMVVSNVPLQPESQQSFFILGLFPVVSIMASKITPVRIPYTGIFFLILSKCLTKFVAKICIQMLDTILCVIVFLAAVIPRYLEPFMFHTPVLQYSPNHLNNP